MSLNKLKTIWIVDDDPSISEAIKILFQELGYNIKNFEGGKDLRASLRKNTPDLIIMDILLTGEDGKIICKSLKENEKYKNIPIILLSANPVVNSDLKSSKAEAFLKKPFDIYELIDLVEKYV